MAWKGEKQRHSTSRKGIRTSDTSNKNKKSIINKIYKELSDESQVKKMSEKEFTEKAEILARYQFPNWGWNDEKWLSGWRGNLRITYRNIKNRK